MSITDELRELADVSWIIGRSASKTVSEIIEIADHIDAEHVRALTELGDSLTSDLEKEWVQLPKDANGEYIHIGDEVQQRNYAGEWTGPLPVMAITDDGCYVVAHGKLSSPLFHVWSKDVRHYHEPTVEDVLREFGEMYCGVYEGSDDEMELIVEYAAKLQLRGDGE